MEGGIRTSRIDWLGEAAEVDVRELLAGQDAGERSDREDAIEFLNESGVRTRAQPVADLLAAAGSMKIGEKSLQGPGGGSESPPGRKGSRGSGCGGLARTPEWTAELDPTPLSRCPVRSHLRKRPLRSRTGHRGKGWGRSKTGPAPSAGFSGSTAATPRAAPGGPSVPREAFDVKARRYLGEGRPSRDHPPRGRHDRGPMPRRQRGGLQARLRTRVVVV
jgi:hypothetical protein